MTNTEINLSFEDINNIVESFTEIEIEPTNSEKTINTAFSAFFIGLAGLITYEAFRSKSRR